MKDRILRLLSSCTLALLLGCASLPSAHAGKMKVVASIPALAALARTVGGENVRVSSIVRQGFDPHAVQASAAMVPPLAEADLLISSGVEYDHGFLHALILAAANPRILEGAKGHLEASENIEIVETLSGKQDPSTVLHHTEGNPHYLYDPRNAAIVARDIADKMSELDRRNAETYQANAARLVSELAAFADEQAHRFSVVAASKRRAFSYHRSFSYLFDWLGIELIDTLETSAGYPPGRGRVRELSQRAGAGAAPLVLQESYLPTSHSRRLAEKTGGRLVRIADAPDFERGQDYLSHLRQLVDAIHGGLSEP